MARAMDKKLFADFGHSLRLQFIINYGESVASFVHTTKYKPSLWTAVSYWHGPIGAAISTQRPASQSQPELSPSGSWGSEAAAAAAGENDLMKKCSISITRNPI